ncbi:MAG: CHAP domain-containing protein [Chloroflexota bacterium]
MITIDQPQPFVDPQAIIRRYTAWCSQGLLDLDIWQTMGMTMDEWMKWYENTRQPLGTVASRITIGEIEAVRYEESTLWTTLWSGEKYIYRLWYTHRGDQSGEKFYKRVLNSVGFLNEEPIKGEDASQSFQGLSLEGFATVNPLITTCCGYTSPGNPFGCCDNKGNCVWWVYYRYGSVPFRYDAWTWWDQVPDYIGWNRGFQPRRDWRNIAWWNRSSSSEYGHVAFAATYTGGSTITISEMLICNSCGRTRTINVSGANGYIFEAKHIPTGINGGE